MLDFMLNISIIDSVIMFTFFKSAKSFFKTTLNALNLVLSVSILSLILDEQSKDLISLFIKRHYLLSLHFFISQTVFQLFVEYFLMKI